MKLKYFTLAMACAMALALTGCSANRDVDNTDPVQPTNSASASQSDRPSAGVGGGAQHSPDANGAQNSAGMGDAIDDIGDAAGDVVQGAGNAIDDVGDAIGDAANSAGRAMR